MTKCSSGEKTLLIIANEPTPYNTDLFNALAALPGWRTSVFYTKTKSWAIDAGHDYRLMPKWHYDAEVSTGKGIIGQLGGTSRLARAFLKIRPRAVLVCGYYGVPHVAAIISMVAGRVPFALWTDQYNIGMPASGAWLARMGRDALRRLVFSRAQAILVCGRPGCDSARQAGCSESKILDFPYVVDVSRMRRLAENCSCIPEFQPKNHSGKVILFSGRLIPRKGLDVLLDAVVALKDAQIDFYLVVEGDGPLRKHYEDRIAAAGISDRVWCAGFRQMDEHAWLVSVADIVVVPSTHDPWGIVVHEGMLMGKPVCAADAVGAAIDRIDHDKTGFVFPSGSVAALTTLLKNLLGDADLRHRVGKAAQHSAEQVTPKRNAQVLFDAMLSRLDNKSRANDPAKRC